MRTLGPSAFDLRVLAPGMDASTTPRSVGSRAEVRELSKHLVCVPRSLRADSRATDQRLGTVGGAPLPRPLVGGAGWLVRPASPRQEGDHLLQLAAFKDCGQPLGILGCKAMAAGRLQGDTLPFLAGPGKELKGVPLPLHLAGKTTCTPVGMAQAMLGPPSYLLHASWLTRPCWV